jgi:methionyl-tRNA formyltransferase
MSDRAKPLVVLIGMGPTALTALQSLMPEFEVAAVLREPEGAGEDLELLASVQGIPIRPTSLLESLVRTLAPACVVISSFNRIIPREFLALCPFVNVHYSLLPAYRGRANVNWAVLNSEAATGISIHTVVPGLDAGEILFQQAVPIGPHTTVSELYRELNELQRQHLGRTVREFLGGARGRSQEEGEATYCCARVPDDGEVDWTASTRQIYAQIRALQPPFPYAYSFLDGCRFEIKTAAPVEHPRRYAGRIPGRIAAIERSSGSVDVLTADGILRVSEIVLPDQGAVPATRLIRSTRATLGLKPRQLLQRICDLERQFAALCAERESFSSLQPRSRDPETGGGL